MSQREEPEPAGRATVEAGGQFAPRRIFVSYGHDEHAALAEQLKRDLGARGHEVWFDVDRLKPGADWESYLEEGLEWVSEAPGAGRVLLLMTPHSVRRPDGFCLSEVARALSRRVSIVPVMVVWSEPPLSICRVQWLDMQDCVPLPERRERYEVRFERLAQALEHDRLDFEGAQSRLLRLLEPLPFDADIAQHLARFTGRQWLFDRIDAWLADRNASRVFWITGKPGVGKTAIACWLCARRREVAAFHLCRHGHVQKSDPRRCVLSIAYQLSSQLPDYQARLNALHLEQIIAEGNAQTLSDALIVQPLSGGFPRPDRTILILIDALDEATVGPRNELATFIAAEFARTPEWLRLVITSRPDPQVMHPLQGLTPYVLDTAAPENEQDIRAYLARELRPFAPGGLVSTASIERILARSEGVFLYVEWIRQELALGRLSLDRVEEFPRGLGEVYAQFFQRQFPDVDAYERGVRPALEIVAAAQEPVELTMLATLLGWGEYEPLKFCRALGSLFTLSEERVQPFHGSVMNWLTDADRAGPYFISAGAGHRRLADIGWEEYQRGAAAMSPYMLAHLPAHLVHAERWDEAEELLTDPTYIQARCAGGMVHELQADYTRALNAWPGHTRYDPFDQPPPEPVPAWMTECTEAVLAGEPDPHPEKGSGPLLAALRALPGGQRDRWQQEPVYAPGEQIPDEQFGPDRGAMRALEEMRRTEESPAAGISSDDRETPVGRVEAFAAFVSSHSALLAWAHEETIPLARNHAATGPVVARASVLAEALARPWVARDPRPPARPTRPACVATLELRAATMTSVATTPDGRMGVSASKDHTVRVLDLASGRCLHVLDGHADEVTAVAVAPGGRTAISASRDHTLRVWDLAAGQTIQVLLGHAAAVTGAAMTPDARLAVSVSDDRTMRVWDVIAGRAVRTLDDSACCARAVAMTPDGRIAVAAGGDYLLRVWDLASGQPLRTVEASPGPPQGAFFDLLPFAVGPDGRTVISASGDRTLRVWDLASGQTLRILGVHASAVAAVALTPDGQTAVSACGDGALWIWDLATGRPLRTLVGHTGPARSIAIAPDGRAAVSAGDDQTVRVWDLPSGQHVRTLAGHTKAVTSVAVSPDGATIVSGGEDEAVRVWDLASGQLRRALYGYTHGVRSVAVTPDGQTVMTVSYADASRFLGHRTVRLWNLSSGQLLGTVQPSAAAMFSAVSPDGRVTAFVKLNMERGELKHTLQLCDPASGQVLRSLQGFPGHLTSIALTPDGRTALCTCLDGTLQAWDLTSGQTLHIVRRHRRAGWGPSVAVSADGRTAVSASGDGTVRVWDLASGQALRTLLALVVSPSGVVTSVAVTPDGRVALSVGTGRALRVWDLASGQSVRVLEGHTDVGTAVSVTPGARPAISAGIDAPPPRATVRVWDLAAGQTPPLDQRHSNEVASVAITPDGRTAVSASSDQTLRVWDFASGQTVRVLEGHASAVAAVGLSPDGKFAASFDRRTLRVWDLASGQMLSSSDALVGASFHASVAVTPDGGTLVAAYGNAKIWDLVSGRPLRRIEPYMGNGFGAVALTPDGRTAIYGCKDGTIQLCDLASGQRLRTLEGHTSAVHGVAVARDGRTVFSASTDRTVRVWDLASGQPLRTLAAHTEGVSCVAISPDGRTVVSGSSDHTLRVWDLPSGKCEAVYFPGGARVMCVSAIGAGGRFACGTSDGQIHFLTLRKSPETPLAVMAARLLHIRVRRPLQSAGTGKPVDRSSERKPGEALVPPDKEPGGARVGARKGIARSKPSSINTRMKSRGKYDASFSATCPSCGQRFVPPSALLKVIDDIARSAGLSLQRGGRARERAIAQSTRSEAPSAAPSPCLELPREAWNEPRLLSECPHCHTPLRFNPFVADRPRRSGRRGSRDWGTFIPFCLLIAVAVLRARRPAVGLDLVLSGLGLFAWIYYMGWGVVDRLQHKRQAGSVLVDLRWNGQQIGGALYWTLLVFTFLALSPTWPERAFLLSGLVFIALHLGSSKRAITEKGIWLGGTLREWKTFRSYQWRGRQGRTLVINPPVINRVYGPLALQLRIPSRKKDTVDRILAEHLFREQPAGRRT